MILVKKNQMDQIGDVLLNKFVRKLYQKLNEQFNSAILQMRLTEIELLEWVTDAKKYKIYSEDCVEDYCRIKLLNIESFMNKKQSAILNNILFNHEILQEQKIILIEKYLYDDVEDSN